MFLGSIIIAPETGGEVAAVRTEQPDGSMRTTRLWVVDDGGYAWLRAGMGRAPWVEQAEAKGELIMTRGERRGRYEVVVFDDPATRDRIHALMREKYGARDRYMDVIRDGASSIAVRLDEIHVLSDDHKCPVT